MEWKLKKNESNGFLFSNIYTIFWKEENIFSEPGISFSWTFWQSEMLKTHF